LSTP
jgi:hypothetical protein